MGDSFVDGDVAGWFCPNVSDLSMFKYFILFETSKLTSLILARRDVSEFFHSSSPQIINHDTGASKLRLVRQTCSGFLINTPVMMFSQNVMRLLDARHRQRERLLHLNTVKPRSLPWV
ncbi:hypothetical protein RRG08_004567 [Elysia crispata]|uniref:Uncharacterized protein n=1 Tax=Elysia crispata TaxID=231223 RepID=A0AAE1E0W8_9GAST|nr:hypothetical protein RRG08_004567 [Elysia crispata]